MQGSTRCKKSPLVPHPSNPERSSDLRLWATIDLSPESLDLVFSAEGSLDQWSIPAPALCPEAREGLWRHTCFELFLGETGSPRYLEFNFSPEGHWTYFQFNDYRHETDRPKGPALRITTRLGPQCLRLTASIPLGFLHNHIQIGSGSRVGLCAILEGVDGEKSHWALRHNQQKPDFHDPTTFEPLLDAPHH